MEEIDLARLQFAVTTLYHFIFVPLTLGMACVMFYLVFPEITARI